MKASTIYSATLNGATEVPPTGSSATGMAWLTLNGDWLAVNVTFSGLLGGPAVAAHIHCCTNPGTNVGAAVPFVNFPALAAGTFMANYDLTSMATYSSTFLASNGGTAAVAEAALIVGLNAGMAYVNIHNTTFPGGEIEGFASSSVPEPASLILLGLGALAMAAGCRVRGVVSRPPVRM